MIRVFLLDDHEVVRNGVAASLEVEDDITVVGESGDAMHALNEVRRCQPDVAILDVRLGDGSGIDVCREITSEFPKVKALMLTSFANDRAPTNAERRVATRAAWRSDLVSDDGRSKASLHR